ncbi:MAG: replication initiation protein, partial [Nitrospinae bacterium]|nr:replication initiation protein [Nitrospinota bacterium]
MMKAKRSAKKGDRRIGTQVSSIQITNKLSLVQHKAWLFLLRNAYREIPNPAVIKHRIPLSELAMYLGYPRNGGDGHFEKMLEGLVDAKVSWDILSKEGFRERGMASMLAGIAVKNGIVEYDYSEFMKEKFYNPKMFALFNLQTLNLFS